MSIRVQVGEIFPPLQLVRRMANRTRPNFQVLVGDLGRQDPDGARVIHVGIRMPEFEVRHRGNLSQGAQEMVLRRLATELKKQFEWSPARTTLDGNVHAFCYPYLGNAEGSVVFCRLEVEETPRGSCPENPASRRTASRELEIRVPGIEI